jgi:polygalacturonase
MALTKTRSRMKADQFDTVAALLAETEGYTRFAVNDIIDAGGFRYQVAASGASDHHVTTAGGVKLYVLAGAEGYNVKAFGAVGDGVTDDTAAIQAALDTGLDLYFGDSSLVYAITAPLVMSAGQRIKADGATVKATAVMDNCLTRASNTEVDGLWIDCNNTQPPSGVPVTQTGAEIGMSFEDIVDTKTKNCRITKYKQGVRVVSTTLGVKCSGHDFINCKAVAGFDWAGSRSSNGQFGAYVGSVASPATTVITDFTGSLMDECEDVFGIRFIGWSAYEGQYGLALHRCSNVSVVGGYFRRMSRCISIQQQSRGITITGNIFHDMDSTGVHIAYGSNQISVTGNRFFGTLQNDSVMVQCYYGVRDVAISDNVMDSKFNLWDGGAAAEQRRPEHGIRVGQQAENITIQNNKIVGFRFGVYCKSTIYETTITSADPNYYNTGFRNIVIAANNISIPANYYVPTATAVKSQMTTTQTYGVYIHITGAWEDVDQGGWDVDGILVEGNVVDNVAFSYVVQTATMSGGANPPEFPDFAVALQNNRSTNATAANVSRTTIGRSVAVTYCGNTWADQQSFTPTLVGDGTPGTQTYTTAVGQWVARGRRIYVRGFINLSAKDAGISGNVVIGGLPAAVKAGSSQDEAGAVGAWGNWSIGAGYTSLNIAAEQGQSRLRLYRNGAGVAAGFVSAAQMGATAQIQFSCEYEAA